MSSFFGECPPVGKRGVVDGVSRDPALFCWVPDFKSTAQRIVHAFMYSSCMSPALCSKRSRIDLVSQPWRDTQRVSFDVGGAAIVRACFFVVLCSYLHTTNVAENIHAPAFQQGEDMEPEEIIDATFPADLMNRVQAAPTELSLAAPKKKKVPRKAPGKGKAAARKTTAAALAAAAKPLGGGSGSRSTSGGGSGRVTRSKSGSGGGGKGKQPEVVVVD